MGRKPGRMHVKGSLGGNRLYPDFLAISWNHHVCPWGRHGGIHVTFYGRWIRGIDCNEGVLEWVEKDRISELNLWEGDRIFFHLLEEREDFFSLKLIYNMEDVLMRAVLDGKELELTEHRKL